MTRINHSRSEVALLTTVVIGLTGAGCTPPPLLVAVATDSSIVVYDAGLTPRDTLDLTAITRNEGTPRAIFFSGDGAHLLVALDGESGGALAQVRRSDAQLIRLLPLPGEHPHRVVLFRDGLRVITLGSVTPGTADSMRGIASLVTFSFRDVDRTAVEVCVGRPLGAAVHSDGEKAYVICDDDTVTEVDAELERVVRRVSLGRTAPQATPCVAADIALSPNETLLLIPCRQSGWLLYLDRVTLTAFDSAAIGASTRHLMVVPRLPSVVASQRDELLWVDLADRAVRTHTDLPAPVRTLTASADGQWLYVTTGDRSGDYLVKVAAGAEGTTARTAVPFTTRALAVWPGIEATVMTWLAEDPVP